MNQVQILGAELIDDQRVRLTFNLQSTPRVLLDDEPLDRDRQVRPGDVINLGFVQVGREVSTQTLDMRFDCLSRHADQERHGPCAGVTAPATQRVDLQFIDRLEGAGRGAPVAVDLLIDQSGSTAGTVQAETCLEGKPNSVQWPEKLGLCSSDTPSIRLAAAKDLWWLLNDHDVRAAYQFNETVGVEPVAEADIDGLTGRGEGRANLWRAVAERHAAMQVRPERARHLVVFTDGPDTCTPAELNRDACFDPPPDAIVQEQCPSNVTFDQAMSQLSGDPQSVHVSFIHFESKGYPGVDPQMQRAAALTGGHYLFIARNSLVNADFRRAMFDNVVMLRTALGGHWTLDVELPALTLVDTGAVYALRGMLGLVEGRLSNPTTRVQLNGLPLLVDCQL